MSSAPSPGESLAKWLKGQVGKIGLLAADFREIQGNTMYVYTYIYNIMYIDIYRYIFVAIDGTWCIYDLSISISIYTYVYDI